MNRQYLQDIAARARANIDPPARFIDLEFVDYLEREIEDRIDSGRSMDSDALRALLYLADK
jgi:hypothetical protein